MDPVADLASAMARFEVGSLQEAAPPAVVAAAAGGAVAKGGDGGQQAAQGVEAARAGVQMLSMHERVAELERNARAAQGRAVPVHAMGYDGKGNA